MPTFRPGRVAGIDAGGALALLPVEVAEAAIAEDRFGARTAFVTGGVFGSALTARGLPHLAGRRLE